MTVHGRSSRRQVLLVFLPGLPMGLASSRAIGQGTPVRPVTPVAPGPGAAELVGHWRKTAILMDAPVDEHLVLNADGRVSTWTVTARSREAPTAGRWAVEGRELVLAFPGRETVSVPFTFHEGKLVLPNIPNRRRFWDRL
jgi:hypothetical protein